MKAYDLTSVIGAKPLLIRPSVVYADCRAALEIAWKEGLDRTVPVRSVAPALLADSEIGVEPADDCLQPENIKLFSKALVAVVHDVWQSLYDNVLVAGEDDANQIALATVRAVAIDLQNEIFAAAQLRQEDFSAGTVAVAVRHETADMRRRFYSGAARLLAEAGQARIIEIPDRSVPAIDEPAPPKPPLWARLSHLGPDTAIYRLGIALSRFLPTAAPRGGILVLRENELLKETAARLLLRGYGLYRLAPVGSSEMDVGSLGALVDEVVGAAIRKNFADHLAPTALDLVAVRVTRAAVANLRRYRSSLPRWRAALQQQRGRRPRAVLTNMLLTPETLGLSRVLRESGIPFVVFQHGVTAEISSDIEHRSFSFDNVGFDLAITFNEEMVRLSADNSFGGAQAVAVGLPGDYQRAARRRGRTDTVWYVSTSLYQSNLGRLHRGLADSEIYHREQTLIDAVLARLPHDVIYKPYPAHRYLDNDPLLDHAGRQANIKLHEERLDLRYLAREARVLLTSGASSTVSRCLMSGRPTIFIDNPDNMPLRDAVREAFVAGIILFDGGAADFHEKLREFLSQPFEEIEYIWEEKTEGRKNLIENYFSAPHEDPAGRAADAVMTKIGGMR